jgi:hypothetical protein
MKQKVLILSILKIKEYLMKKIIQQIKLQTERERIRYEAELAAANKSGADTTLITNH